MLCHNIFQNSVIKIKCSVVCIAKASLGLLRLAVWKSNDYAPQSIYIVIDRAVASLQVCIGLWADSDKRIAKATSEGEMTAISRYHFAFAYG